MAQQRWHRRMAGLLKSRLPDAGLHRVADPRQRRGRWRLGAMLGGIVIGMLSGAKRLADVEARSREMSTSMRRLLGLRGRLPDTTLRDLLIKLDPAQLRLAVHRQVRVAHRRHALEPDQGLPWGVLSLDGKMTAIRAWDDRFAQRQKDKGLVRTITATLVSSAARVCVDAFPIPPQTNEMGAYVAAVADLVRAYESIDLFRVVMYDAGACSEANARATRGMGLHYVMVLNDAQPTLHREARRMLDAAGDQPSVFDEVEQGIRYSVELTSEMAGYLDWQHLRTVVRIRREVLDTRGQVLSAGARVFVSSLRCDALSPRQWLRLTRARWGVENNCHHTFDTAPAEDARPWIVTDPVGALNVILLRRIAYNLMTLLRSRTLRGELSRLSPWKDLIRHVYNALVAATDRTVADIRPRDPPPLTLAP